MRTHSVFDPEMNRPPQLFGCERTPALVLTGIVLFLVVVVFGFGISGIAGGILIFLAGLIGLRRCAVYDPYLFAVLAEALRYPLDLPRTPRVRLPALPFIGEAADDATRVESSRRDPGAEAP